ncbi:PHB depolymerase family esterase [Actinoplanes sp. GCM10030250]|uniref:extracellular catalytic domain type 1 short-chain-length polyhydroxyalkanoate depolymerase n=1 Tax=Actinoplanes sp. GCM10030250 TaxID=3273376 RepID=UPI0036140808
MRRTWRTLLAGAAAAVAIAAGLTLPAGPAAAASLQEVTGFGTNPTNLRMHLYVPDRLAAKPALLVAVHYCTGSGPAFYSGTEFASLANQYGFIVVYPSATRSGNCFDVSTAGALSHNGNSDPAGIVSMVRYVQQRYGTDADRTFVTGASSGAMTTNVLLGDYPDVFAAGAAFAGVPFGCFATTDGSMWNSACAQGQISRTPQAWGDLVRAAYPGYTGRRPRMQVFHGTNDDTLRYPNFGEQIKQWTNVLGVSQTPVATDTPQAGWTRTRYGANSAQAPVEGISVAGGTHSMPMSGMARMAITFFGLDSTTPGSPSASPSASPSSSPSGSPSASPSTSTPPPPTGACSVRASVSAWNTGLTTNLTLTNTGTSTVSGWGLAFTLPSGQSITSGWNATYSPTSGQVTARNAAYNGTVAPGASVTLGYQATHTGNAGAPSGYALNGAACTAA